MENDSKLNNYLGLARTALIAGNVDEAISYFNRVLEIDPAVTEAWLGKGKAAAWQSTLSNIKIQEMLVSFINAIGSTSIENKYVVIEEAVSEINHFVATVYGMARRHMDEYVALQDSWSEYLRICSTLIDALETAREWDPEDITTLDNIAFICRQNIEGVAYRDPYDNNTSKAWHLSPEYEKIIRSKLDNASAALKILDKNYNEPIIEKKKAQDCFILTATFQDAQHPVVVFMRSFRDQWLISRTWGAWMIRIYYNKGPRIANFIAVSKLRRKVALFAVVYPAMYLARLLMLSRTGRH